MRQCERWLVFVFHVEGECKTGKNRAEKKTGKERLLTSVEVEDEGSTKAECRGLFIGLISVRRVESASNFRIPCENYARETYNSEESLVALTEVTTPTTWYEEFIAQ